MPSGRWIDSTLMTSAPIAGQVLRRERTGPERGEVDDAEAGERAADAPSAGADSGARVRAASDGQPRARHRARRARAPATSGRSVAADRRYGGRGWTNSAPGWRTKTPRATKWSKLRHRLARADRARRGCAARRRARRSRRRRAVASSRGSSRSPRRPAACARPSARARRRRPGRAARSAPGSRATAGR